MESGGRLGISPCSKAYEAAIAIASPCGAKASAEMEVGYLRNWQSRFLCAASHRLTRPSPPPVAKVPSRGWKHIAWTGKTASASLTTARWHLRQQRLVPLFRQHENFLAFSVNLTDRSVYELCLRQQTKQRLQALHVFEHWFHGHGSEVPTVPFARCPHVPIDIHIPLCVAANEILHESTEGPETDLQEMQLLTPKALLDVDTAKVSRR